MVKREGQQGVGAVLLPMPTMSPPGLFPTRASPCPGLPTSQASSPDPDLPPKPWSSSTHRLWTQAADRHFVCSRHHLLSIR